MQKRENESSNSTWQENINKEKRNNLLQKLVIWGGVALVTIAGIALLVKFAGGGSSTNVQTVTNLPKVSSADIIVGDKAAKVTLIEYSDFQCPACASYNPIVNQALSAYQGKINLVYRFFPLTSIHKNAVISAQAGYAAWKMGKFAEMKDQLFENQTSWENLSEADAKKAFIDYAKSIKLDSDQFSKLMESNEAKDVVTKSQSSALGLGLQGTPTFFLGNKQISPANYDDLKSKIDEELNGGKPLK